MDWRRADALSAVCQTVHRDLVNACVWNKSNAGMGSLYRSKHELIYVYRVGSARYLNTVELGRHGHHRTNVWEDAPVNSMRGGSRSDLELFPTVKPPGLFADALCDLTRRGDLGLDAFLGSGASLIAAKRTGRRCRGLEIDPAHIDMALARWTAITGKKPRRLRPEEAA